ncbi:MAG: hypothetical protein U9N85_03130 [Bacteroidota bacterium]|nr:hypothetical protein [Bacteroidota bacterium]
MIKRILSIAVIISLTIPHLFSQKTIVGVTLNYAYNPLDSVKVSTNDSSAFVLTNAKGEYEIEVPENSSHIIFRYKTLYFSEKIKGRSVINKTMSSIQPEKETYRYSVQLNAGGPTIFGSVSGSMLITQSFSIELGLAFAKANIGINAFFKSPFINDYWQPYIGAQAVFYEEFMGSTYGLLYTPIGFRYMNSRGTTFSVEVAGLFSNKEGFVIKSPVWGGIKFGKYF